MLQNAEHIVGLITRFLEQTLDEPGQKELNEWIERSADNRALFDQLTSGNYLSEGLERFYAVDTTSVWNKLLQRIELPGEPVRTPRVVQMKVWRYVAAAVVIISLSAGAYLWFHKTVPIGSHAAPIAKRFKNDVQPGGDRATLTLADGSAIALQDMNNGSFIQQGGTKVNKEISQLVYTSPGSPLVKPGTPLSYNTISTPKGGQFKVVLPDGSKVWLNAASSLSFPVLFADNERNVELSGEAYFEVAPLWHKEGNGKIPFRVSVNGMKVEVLGTKFNIMAYSDEEAVKTTLVEGAVKVVSVPTPHSTLEVHDAALVPGQQSQLDRDGIIKVVKDIDINGAVAWKDGMFHFKDADITSIMRQVERWYDAEVVYENTIPDHFVGDIPRNMPASRLLELLEMTNRVHFKIEGKKITVML